jgi:hypothetical protein
MVEVSRRLNPGCAHHVGDMRTVRLGREFDAVLVHDAVDYLTTEDDLSALIATAYAHLRPGGIVVLVPDHTRETFEDATDHGGTDGADGRGVRYLEWSWDPDPADSVTRTEYAFLLREPDGTIRLVHETHVTGLFDREVWLRLLTSAGFRAEALPEETEEERVPREIFIGHRVTE